jgi:Icc-related predicted phosphoesterase
MKRLEALWGTPWQPYFFDWAFNAPERYGEEFLNEKFQKIPRNTDIVICHGPPHGYGDRVGDPNVSDRTGQPQAGSRALTDRLSVLQPRLMVCGHIHSGRGIYQLGSTKVVNASLVNNKYEAVYEPVIVDL